MKLAESIGVKPNTFNKSEKRHLEHREGSPKLGTVPLQGAPSRCSG